MLRDLDLKKSYRSDSDNIVSDFYIPCLSNSLHYQRAVGFFSSSSLSVASKGLHVFLRSGGTMELVASPYLSKKDIEEIKNGYILRHEAEQRSVINALEGEFDDIIEGRLNTLSNLIELNRLEIKIATVRDRSKYGIYHEKLGVFHDGQDFVVFTGSPNESESGLVNNFESIDVFCSWRDSDKERAEEKHANFQRLWNDNTRYLSIMPFPEAARRSLLKRRKDTPLSHDPEEDYEEIINEIPQGCPQIPVSLKLRDYQRNAIENWIQKGRRGTFKMATGSGKTITALSVVERSYAEDGLRAVIIIAPYLHLVAQWAKECKEFGLLPLLCFESQSKWAAQLQSKLYSLNTGNAPFLTVIVTNSTFVSSSFQSLIEFFPKDTLIIGDEAHNLGSKKFLGLLPVGIEKRLALSATPERWFDEEGTDGLFHYFGPICIEFTLEDALKSKALVPYRYFPMFVNLTDNEIELYRELSKKIAKAYAINTGITEERKPLEALLFQRSRLIGSAQNKLSVLKQLMEDRLDTSHTLFYCGDGTVEDETSDMSYSQLDIVCKILSLDVGFRVDKYVAETPLEDRENLRYRFDKGDIQGLVAIRCLDEGVDIPSTQTAVILASSSNPRQFIQRRGRVLRWAANKDEAVIFDMIVLPPQTDDLQFESERTLLKKEFDRYLEFAKLAINAGEVISQLIEKQKSYNLL